MTLNDHHDPRELRLAHLYGRRRRRLSRHSVDVRTFEPQHDANFSRVHAASGHRILGPTTATAAAAATTVPHGNIPRTARTAATAIPSEPDPGAVAAGATSARGSAPRPGAPGLTAAATGSIPPGGPGYPAAAAPAPAADPGEVKRRANATRTTR